MSFLEMMARAAAQEESRPPLPLPEAVADTLKERFAAMSVPHNFGPGDLVIGKRGLDPRNHHYEEMPMIVVDIDLTGYPVTEAFSPGGYTYRHDIAVLTEESEHGIAVVRLYDSRLLEPWPRAAVAAADKKD
jgi:hypothetical protein